MKKVFSRFTGVLIILIALLTWGASITGIVYIWKTVPRVNTALTAETDSASSLLDSTAGLISGVNGSLAQAEEKLSVISSTGGDIASMVDTTATISADMAKVSHTDLPTLVTSVQASLKSMETTASLIDDTLGLLSYIPFLSSKYKPDVPLNAAVSQVSHDLDNLPAVFSRMDTNMGAAAAQLTVLKGDIVELVSSMEDIQSNLKKIQQTMQDYQAAIQQAQERLAAFRKNLTGWIDLSAWIFTGFLAWLALTQVTGFIQGLQLLSPGKLKGEVELKGEPV